MTYQLPNGISKYITNGASACAPSERLCFYFSGKHAPGYTPLLNGVLADAQNGAEDLADTLLTIDMTAPGQAQWTNTTLENNVDPRASGQLVWVPVSEQGVLLAIGGVTNPIDLNALVALGADSQSELKLHDCNTSV